MTSTIITPTRGASPGSGVGVGEGGCPPCKSQKGVGGSKGPWSVVTISPPLESQFLHMRCLYNFHVHVCYGS